MTRIINYHGSDVSITALARLTGIAYATLSARYNHGDKDAQLWRPLDHPNRTKRSAEMAGENNDLLQMKQHQQTSREIERRKQAERDRRNRERSELRKRIQREHAELFARPLISAGTLTKRERDQIAERVRHSGQRSWSVKGLGA